MEALGGDDAGWNPGGSEIGEKSSLLSDDDATSSSVTGGLTFGFKPVRLIRVKLVLVNLNPINDTYITERE